MAHKYHKSPLLELLNERKCWDLKGPYVQPQYDPKQVREASLLHGSANDSDPFAYRRMQMHLLQGFELPSSVIKDSKAAMGRRRGEAAVLNTRLEEARRQAQATQKQRDADKAWNQFRSARYLEGKAA